MNFIQELIRELSCKHEWEFISRIRLNKRCKKCGKIIRDKK
jgi:hypothetical protein